MVRILLGLMVSSTLFLTACGPDCESSCNKMYGTSPGCAIKKPGLTPGEAKSGCLEACVSALSNPGDLGDYQADDDSTDGLTTDVNDQQAAAWMDCVAATACPTLKEGYCAIEWAK